MVSNFPDVYLKDFPEAESIRGVIVAKRFLEDYPDSMGRANFAVYGQDVEPWQAEMIVYRTKTRITVRWVGGIND